jgi:hypothetical protein
MSAVRPRGPRIFLAVVILTVIGGALWFFFGREPGPIGAAEDPGKVLVVAGEEGVIEEIEQLGLEVEHGSLDELQGRAQADVEGLETTGPEAILALADQLGIGYVAFADPSTLTFGTLPVTPSSAAVTEQDRWAVLSVGELGTPHHHVTVPRDDRLYALPTSVALLRALFEQEKLAATLVGEEKLSTEAKPLFEQVKAATKLLGGYGLLDAKARRIDRDRKESIDEPEEAEPEPATLADPLEITSGFPVANGGIVLFSERPRLASPRDPEVHFEYPGVAQAFFLPPGATATADRQPCEAPGSGASLQHAIVTAAGDAMLRAAGDVVEVWSMPATTQGCPFARKGTIASGTTPGSVNASGRVLRPVDVDGSQMVEVWTPDQTQPQVWPMSGCSAIGRPEWIDDTHFAIPCRFDPLEPEEADPYADEPPPPEPEPETPPPIPEQTWIYLVSTHTGQVLAWLVADTYLPTLHLRAHAKLSLLVDLDGSRLLLLTAQADTTSVFQTPPLDPTLPRPAFVPADETGVAALASNAFDGKQLTIDSTAQALLVSPTGTHLAFEVDRDPFSEWSTNVAVLDLASGSSRRVAIDRWAAHERPRFTADGKTLVFQSRYEADDRTMTALRTVPVP